MTNTLDSLGMTNTLDSLLMTVGFGTVLPCDEYCDDAHIQSEAGSSTVIMVLLTWAQI